MLSASRIISAHGAGPTPEVMARLGKWLALLLVVMLAWTLAQLTWTLFAPRETGPLPVARDLPSYPLAATSRADEVHRLAAVADLQLFGHAQAVAEAPVVPTEAPETRLRLTLKGVVASSAEPVLGVALIADDRQNERHYRVGAELPGGARLEQIFSDRVILSREGRFEMLRLPRETLDSAAVVPASTRPGRHRRAGTAVAGCGAGGQPGNATGYLAAGTFPVHGKHPGAAGDGAGGDEGVCRFPPQGSGLVPPGGTSPRRCGNRDQRHPGQRHQRSPGPDGRVGTGHRGHAGP